MPASFFVSNTNDSGTGSLRAALISANATSASDSIFFTALFDTPQTIELASTLTVTNPVNIFGPGANLLTVSGKDSVQGFALTGATGTLVFMSGFRIEHCGDSSDGAIDSGNSYLNLTAMHLRNNSSGSGSGGVNVGTSGRLWVYQSTMNDNNGIDGGAIHCYSTSSTIIVLENSTLSANTSKYDGGAIDILGSLSVGGLAIRNSTIVNNSAGGDGGGLFAFGSIDQIDVLSSIVAANSATSSPDIYTNGPVLALSSLIGSNSGFTFAIGGGGNLTGTAGLGLGILGDNGGPTPTHLPSGNSNVINKGHNYSSQLTDQRGGDYVRLQSTEVDIGAVEVGNLIVTNINDDGGGSLRRAVSTANLLNDSTSTIRFESEYFSVPRTITLTTGELNLAAPMAITGPGAALTAISGNKSSRIFNASAAPADTVIAIYGLTIADGKAATGSGGAILGEDATLHIDDCIIRDCSAVQYSGAIDVSLGGSLELRSSAVYSNSAFQGGGLYFFEGDFLLVENSTISGNFAEDSAGGMIVSFRDSGGSSDVVIRNSTIVSNTTQSGSVAGVRFYAGNGSAAIVSSVVSGNMKGSFAGVDVGGAAAAKVSASYSAIGTYKSINLTGSNNLPFGTDVKIGSLAFYGSATPHHMPAADSPLINNGNNPGLLEFDQRGYPRHAGSAPDIGAIELATTTVNSITRIGPEVTSDASVSWYVFFPSAAPNLTGITAANFTLVGPGATGAVITNVLNAGYYSIVTADTGADGLLGLNMVSAAGMNILPTNLPFVGQTYIVDKVPLALASLKTDMAKVTDASVGPSRFNVTATFTEAMDTATAPIISFPVENPGNTLIQASGTWLNDTQYRATFNVNDFNLTLPAVDVRVSGAKDSGGVAFGPVTVADVFDIDTANPIVLVMTRNQPTNNKLASVSWDVTFSEAVTGVDMNNFTLFIGGVGGSPAITGVSGSGTTWTVTASTGGSGSGNLGLYAVNSGSVVDASGNSLAALPAAGPNYALDFVSPAASQLTLNTLLLSDANVGPSGFTATIRFNELMDQGVNPVVSFPAEFPNSLTFNGGVWLDAQTFQAKFNVADLGVTQNDIDLRFTGAQDLVGNVQAQFDAVDIFDIDTQNPIVASITSASPNGTYTVGQSIDITLHFSEVVTLAGMLNVTLDTGAVVSIFGPASGTSFSGTYVVGPGESSSDLNVTAIALAGGSTLKDTATNNAVLTLPGSNLANNAAIVVGGSAVTGFSVNQGFGAPFGLQRSRVTNVVVSFAAPVNAAAFQAAGAVTLTRTTDTPIVLTTVNGLIVSPASGSASSLTLTFADVSAPGIDNASLSDGYWQLGVPSAGYAGTPTDIRRLFGDINNDGTVDGAIDFPAFGAQFNTTGANLAFDFNNDGIVDGAVDFPAFGANFNRTL